MVGLGVVTLAVVCFKWAQGKGQVNWMCEDVFVNVCVWLIIV